MKLTIAKDSKPVMIILFFCLLTRLFWPANTCFAQYQVEFTPSISVSEQYDDNINLEPENEVSDYITSVSPSIQMTVRSQKTDFNLAYTPSFVWYDEEDQNNTTRHSGTLNFDTQLSQYIRFMLTDTYLRSEEPLEDTEDIEGVRNTRNKYQRNTSHVGFRYLFGPENALNIGYNHSWLENDDVTLDDGTTQNPYANVSYWFDKKNGMELDYAYTKAIFWRDDDTLPGDDYDGHMAGIRYNYRFTPYTSMFIGYNFTNRTFEGTTEDYDVHEGSTGMEHAFSENFSMTIGGGYFKQENEITEDQTGYTYNANLTKRFEWGNFNIGGLGGWDENYLDAERRGFTRYWSAVAGVQYQIYENLRGFVNGSYRLDRESTDREWYTLRGNGGFQFTFFRWYSLSLDYTYAERDDDVNTEDYKVNRIMLRLTARKLYRW